ncbi:hypothetical protein BU15DRAFT_20154, partial [Melanogaster broomeanus]
MPGHAKSAAQKKVESRKTHDGLMSQAIKAYQAELAKPPGIRRHGARTICRDFEKINLEATGQLVKLSYCTLIRLASGGKSKAEANAEKSWLTTEEIEQVIAYAEEIANRGFPLSHRRLREHVNEICHARLGDAFPGVGKKW